MYGDKMKQVEEEMTPFGFIDDGVGDVGGYEIDVDGTVWRQADDWIRRD